MAEEPVLPIVTAGTTNILEPAHEITGNKMHNDPPSPVPFEKELTPLFVPDHPPTPPPGTGQCLAPPPIPGYPLITNESYRDFKRKWGDNIEDDYLCKFLPSPKKCRPNPWTFMTQK